MGRLWFDTNQGLLMAHIISDCNQYGLLGDFDTSCVAVEEWDSGVCDGITLRIMENLPQRDKQ